MDYMDFNKAIQSIRVPEVPKTPANQMWADTQFEIIKKYIQSFEESLDDEHEVGFLLTNFGQSVLMQVTEVSFEEPVLMVFNGYVDGKPATLIQHINQLNFLLTKIEKEDPKAPKRKIGFLVEE